MRKIKSDRDICKCGNIECSQKDNVYRDGYVSVESQFKQFQRAGINRLEWLKKAYPQDTVKKHEENLFDKNTREALFKAEMYNRGDELNILDGKLRAERELKAARENYNKALSEYEINKAEYEKSIKESNESNESTKSE